MYCLHKCWLKGKYKLQISLLFPSCPSYHRCNPGVGDETGINTCRWRWLGASSVCYWGLYHSYLCELIQSFVSLAINRTMPSENPTFYFCPCSVQQQIEWCTGEATFSLMLDHLIPTQTGRTHFCPFLVGGSPLLASGRVYPTSFLWFVSILTVHHSHQKSQQFCYNWWFSLEKLLILN